jgi:hypothetical protein
MALLPWLLSTLLSVKRRLTPPTALAFAGVLADRLVQSPLKCPRTLEVLRSVVLNAGSASVDSVISTIASEIHEAVFPQAAPECIDVWSEMVQNGTASIAEAALEVTARVLALRPPELAQYYAGLLRPTVQHVTAFGPMVPAATRIVQQISAPQPMPQKDPTRTLAGYARQPEPPGPRYPPSSRVIRLALGAFDKKASRKSASKALWKHFSEKIADMPGRAAPRPPLSPLQPLEGLGASSRMIPLPLIPETPASHVEGDEPPGSDEAKRALDSTASLPPSAAFSPTILRDSIDGGGGGGSLGLPLIPMSPPTTPQKSSVSAPSPLVKQSFMEEKEEEEEAEIRQSTSPEAAEATARDDTTTSETKKMKVEEPQTIEAIAATS